MAWGWPLEPIVGPDVFANCFETSAHVLDKGLLVKSGTTTNVVRFGGEQIGDIRSSMALLAKVLTNIALTLHRQSDFREEGLELFEKLISLNVREARLALDVLDRRPFQR